MTPYPSQPTECSKYRIVGKKRIPVAFQMLRAAIEPLIAAC